MCPEQNVTYVSERAFPRKCLIAGRPLPRQPAFPDIYAPPAIVSCCTKYSVMILSRMEQYQEQLNGIFQALADPTRRAILGRLGEGPASISDLAKPFEMALPSFMKHIHLLEDSGLIQTRKEGRVRTCTIQRKQFAVVETWLSAQRAIWEGRTDRLEQFVSSVQKKEKSR